MSNAPYRMRFAIERIANAAPRLMNPSSIASGTGLAVDGSSVLCTIGAGATAATSACAGGGVTTSASCASSPVGLMAIIGARLSSITIGSTADLIGSATSRGSSTGVNRTGVLVALANSIAFAFSLDEFLAPIAARVKPGAQHFRLACRSLAERNHCLVSRLKAVVRNSENCKRRRWFRPCQRFERCGDRTGQSRILNTYVPAGSMPHPGR